MSRQIKSLVEGVMVGMAEFLTLGLAEVNPIDTGHSHWNWIPGVGYKPTAEIGSKRNPTDSGQIAGLAELDDYSLVWGDGSIHVTNNVHYVGLQDATGRPGLNAGSSGQASPGWIERVIDTTVAVANAAFRRHVRVSRR
jgi:hypothetical protein